jgi:hypothetical protein
MVPILMVVISNGGLFVGWPWGWNGHCLRHEVVGGLGSRLGLLDLLCCCIMASDDGLIGVGIAFACLGFPYDAENVPQELRS